MKEKGIVCEKNEKSIIVKVFSNNSSCNHCKIKSTCAGKNNNKYLTLETWKYGNFEIDDNVIIEVPESKSILFSFLVFLMPLLVFLIFYVILSIWINHWIKILLSFFGTILYFCILIILQKKIGRNIKIYKDVKVN